MPFLRLLYNSEYYVRHTSEVTWLAIDIWAISHDLDHGPDRDHDLFLCLSPDLYLFPYLSTETVSVIDCENTI